jgi:hypothetical protein
MNRMRACTRIYRVAICTFRNTRDLWIKLLEYV